MDYDAYIDKYYSSSVPREAAIQKESPMEVENSRIVEAVRWATKAADAIHAAGGSARVLNDFPDKLIATMVRNSINLTHK